MPDKTFPKDGGSREYYARVLKDILNTPSENEEYHALNTKDQEATETPD